MLATHITQIRRAAVVALMLLVTGCQTAPVQEMSDARQAITVAMEAGAEQHAPNLLQTAVVHLRNAEKLLNERKYELARRDAVSAKSSALDALRRTESSTDPDERMHILTRVHHEAYLVGLEPELVLAVIEVESNFDRYAVSVAGALGLMQVMPFWRNEIGRPDDNLIRLETNLRYGCTILKFYLDKEEGDLRRALGRYNGSLGKRKYPNKVIEKLSEKWFQG